MNECVHVTLAAGAETNGLATMLADLICQNLQQKPRKWVDFRKLAIAVHIDVRDADVSITLAFGGGGLTVHAGVHGEPQLRIATSAEVLLGLCMMKVVNGVPRPLHRDSRALIGNLLRGEVKISGMFRSPVQLIRFARLVSVNG